VIHGEWFNRQPFQKADGNALVSTNTVAMVYSESWIGSGKAAGSPEKEGDKESPENGPFLGLPVGREITGCGSG